MDVKALKSVWFIGDNFLLNNFNALQMMKSEAAVNKSRLPYLYDNYNIQAWYMKQIKTELPVIAKLQNTLVAAFNDHGHLPKYIFIIPDKDIIESIELFDSGVKKAIFDNLTWLSKAIGRCLVSTREDLKDKNSPVRAEVV